MEVDEPLQSPATPTDASGSGPLKFKLKFVGQPGQSGQQDVNMSEPAAAQETPDASMATQQPIQPVASGSALPEEASTAGAAISTIVAPPPVPDVPVKKKRAPPKKKADKPPKAEKPSLPDGEVKPHWRRGLKGKAADAAQYYNSEVKPDTPPTRSRPRKSKAATGDAGTPEPGALPGTSSFSVAAPKAATGPLNVLPLAAKTPATRKWQKAPFSFVNIAGSTLALSTWTGSEDSPFMDYQKKNEPAKVEGTEGDGTPKATATKDPKPKKAPLPAKTAAIPLMPDQPVALPPMSDQSSALPPMPEQGAALPPMPDQSLQPDAPSMPHPSMPAPAGFSPQHHVHPEYPHQAYPAQHFSPMHAYSSPQPQRSPYAPHPSSSLAHHPAPSSSHLGSASPMSLTNLMSPTNAAPGPYFAQPAQPAHLSPHQMQGPFPPQMMQRSSSHGSGSQQG